MISKYGFKPREEELKSGINICKRLANNYYRINMYESNNDYTYEDYLSTAYYGLTRAIKYFNRDKASFARIVYICCNNDLNMMVQEIDKKYNYKKREFEPKIIANYSLNEPIKNDKNKNNNENTLEDLIEDKYKDDSIIDVKDYVNKIFDELYLNMHSRAKRQIVNKQRDIDIILDICNGFTPTEAGKRQGVSYQVVNTIIKKFKKYVIENEIIYQI